MRLSRTCGKKIAFRTIRVAQKHAEAFEQNVYKCPVCFCYHCTSEDNWRQDLYSKAQMQQMETNIRTEVNAKFKDKLKEKNIKITELEKTIKDLNDLK